MANYSLVANSVFQPFSYQELAAPVMEMSAYHEKLADEYDKLSQQADILEAMGKNDRDKDSGTYNRYKAYSDALKREADNLYANGLDTESRHRLTELRRRYNTDIVPIQNAWNKREEEVKMQTTARLQNPHLMFTREAIDSSLEDYINNPTGGFGVINGANITAQMSAMAKNLAAQVRSGRKEGIDEVTYRYIEKYGLTEDLIRNWRNNPTLSKMYEQVMKANGATPELLNSSANAADILGRSTNYAEMGMWDAMGADKSQLRDDPLKLLEAQAAKEIAVAQAKQAITNQEAAVQNMRNEGNIPLFFDKITTIGDTENGFKPSTINALELRFGAANEKNDDVLKTAILPRVTYQEGKTKIRPIKYIQKNGKVITEDKNVDVDEFIDSKGNVKDTPLFHMINTPDGSNAIIMRMGGKSYLIPGGDLGNIFGESNADVKGLYNTYTYRQSLIDKYGEDAYWASPISATIEQTLNNYGAASVRRGVTGTAGGYTIPTYQTHITNEKKLE